MEYKLFLGDCLDKLKDFEDNSIDSIVTDPPYGLSFMGQKWDYDVPSVDIWKECHRVLKPGGHLLSFAGSRTYHRMAVNIEDAGFEIRDQIMWVYGSGFPKSHNIGKAIDKKLGCVREVVGKGIPTGSSGDVLKKGMKRDFDITKGSSEWEGWGTALKPAHEPIVLARKPFKGTVADNVLEYGTGAINIDGCRVGEEVISTHNAPKGTFAGGEQNRGSDTSSYKEHIGRWPANFIHDGSEEVLELFPDNKSSSGGFAGHQDKYVGGKIINKVARTGYDDEGSAARFFYCPKANKKDRNEGCDELPEKFKKQNGSHNGKVDTDDLSARWQNTAKNNHPTVKPTELMRYLIRLVTPKNGTVLDPFMGSGSTGKACMLEGFNFIGIEMSEEYLEIAKRRINFAITENE